MSAVQGWQPLEARSLALVGAASLFLAGGYHFIVRSTREGDFSVIAPVRYTGLVLALLIGWVVWGDLPDALGWAGLALLMATGEYLIRAERRRATG
jgi:drug/metabolite transporter (DMT)-like permease